MVINLRLIKNGIREIRRNGWTSFFSRARNYLFNPRKRAIKEEIYNWQRQKRPAMSPKRDSECVKGLVSVIVPVYNRTKELRECIDSLLAQTYQNLEIILVTDGSPKETWEVVESYRSNPKVKIFHFFNNTGNAVRGRNKGIKEARGEYLAFQDSDDVALPDRLEKSVNFLQQQQVDVVYGGYEVLLDGTRQVSGLANGQPVMSKDFTFEELLQNNPICQSTVLARRSALWEVGGLKRKMEYFEDYELWLRLLYFGYKFKALDEVLVKLRLHEGNNELNFKKDSDQWYQLMLKEYQHKGRILPKVVYIIPGVGISGGVAVVLQHTNRLLKLGYDVSILTQDLQEKIDWFPNQKTVLIPLDTPSQYLKENIDILIATGWSTAPTMDQLAAKRKIYFVQSDERRFFDDPEQVRLINETYKIDCEYMTEAKWIQNWLQEEFGHESFYVPNGLDQQWFHPVAPIEPKSARPRVLIEGRIDIPFKGVKESYEAVKDLDCEIWFVGSGGEPQKGWRYDKFFANVPIDKMKEVYSSCDILLKMSKIEGFFGPPMEAMACGCAVVVGKVTGYDEYIKDGYNALVVEQGDVQGAKGAVKQLIEDSALRQKLVAGGHETVKEWGWEYSVTQLINLIAKSNT